MIKKFVCIPLMCLSASSAFAQQAPSHLQNLITPDFIEELKALAKPKVVKVSIDAQNQQRGSLDQSEIDALDQQWREETEAPRKPLIAATISSPLSSYLLRCQAESAGLYREIFIMDANGLNVGQSTITTDYWQGDEAKFQKTFDVGPTAIFIDEPEFDDKLNIWKSQVSMTLQDEATSEAIGVMTVEVNLTELSRRRAPVY
jgi:hypothetical protein